MTNVKYPFESASTTMVTVESGDKTVKDVLLPNNLPSTYMQAGQFFVVWGIFSFLYGIVALIVYMLTTANHQLEGIVNFLILTVGNIGMHMCTCTLYIITCTYMYMYIHVC